VSILGQIFTADLFAASIRLATPIALAAMGAAIGERSGVVNIALEGIMLVAAFFGTVAAIYTHNIWLGVVGGVIGALAFTALHAWASINLQADQIVSGTAINILALGVTGFLMEAIFGHPGTTDPVPTLPPVFNFPTPGTGPLAAVWSWIDTVFFSYTPLVYFGMFCAVFMTWALFRTSWARPIPSASASCGGAGSRS